MATFSQWVKTRSLHPVVWACGGETCLVREVTREFLGQAGDAVVRVMSGDTPEKDVWDWLLESPPARRYTVAYRAERLQLTGLMPVLLDSLPELCGVLFVSGEEDFTRVAVPGSARDQLAPHLAAIREHKAGQMIRCCRPSKEEDLLKLVASWWPGAGSNLAAALLARCGGNLEAAHQACETARRARLPGNESQLDLACQRRPGTEFAQLVIAGKLKEAATGAGLLSAAESLQALGRLNADLAQVRSYAMWSSRGLAPDEIEKRGISRYRQRLLAPHAGKYGPEREIRCRQLLASAEEALRSGAREGVLESLAALW